MRNPFSAAPKLSARNYRVCVSRAAHTGEGSCGLRRPGATSTSLRGIVSQKKLSDATVFSLALTGVGGRQLGIGWRVRDAMRVAHCQRHGSPCAEIQALGSLPAELRRTSVLITGGQDRLQRQGGAEGGENICSVLSLSLCLCVLLSLYVTTHTSNNRRNWPRSWRK